MTLVVDASIVVAALIESSVVGDWALDLIAGPGMVAPHHMPVEVANILRRTALAGTISSDNASLAHADLSELGIQLLPYAPVAQRVWQLRENVTAYDAWYVALAEALACPLATLDVRMTRATGPRCAFIVPPI